MYDLHLYKSLKLRHGFGGHGCRCTHFSKKIKKMPFESFGKNVHIILILTHANSQVKLRPYVTYTKKNRNLYFFEQYKSNHYSVIHILSFLRRSHTIVFFRTKYQDNIYMQKHHFIFLKLLMAFF
jgi:hypothetical protein